MFRFALLGEVPYTARVRIWKVASLWDDWYEQTKQRPHNDADQEKKSR